MWGHFEMLNFASPIKKVDKKLYIVYKKYYLCTIKPYDKV